MSQEAEVELETTADEQDTSRTPGCTICGFEDVETRRLAYNPHLKREEVTTGTAHEIWTDLRESLSDPEADPHGRGKRWEEPIKTIQAALERPVTLRAGLKLDICPRCIAILAGSELDEPYPRIDDVQFSRAQSAGVELASLNDVEEADPDDNTGGSRTSGFTSSPVMSPSSDVSDGVGAFYPVAAFLSTTATTALASYLLVLVGGASVLPVVAAALFILLFFVWLLS